MSFVFISMLVFLGLGGMAAVMDNRPVAKLKLKPGTMRGLYSTVMVLASIVLIFVSIRYIGASQDVVKAKNLFTTSNDFQEIKTPLDKALSKRGDHPDAVLYMSSLLQAVYSQTKDESFYNEELNLLTNTLKKSRSTKICTSSS